MPCPAHYTDSMISAISCCKSQKREEPKAARRWISKMDISLPLLFLFIGSASAEKQGDFGIFTACIAKNESLRLDCYYANCSNSPPFDCEFMDSSGLLMAKASNEMCRLIIPNHPRLYGNKTTSYNCTLTRRKRKEEKQITIDYTIRKGKKHIGRCRDTVGLMLHRTPTLLWLVVIWSLWGILITDSQAT